MAAYYLAPLGYPLLVVVICVADMFNLNAGCVAILRVHFVGHGCRAVRCDVFWVREAGGYLALE